MIARRGFLGFLTGIISAPVIVSADSLMKIKGEDLLANTKVPHWCPPGWLPCDGRPLNESAFPILSDRLRALRFPIKVPLIYPRGREITIIAATDMVRSNGSIMRAGAFHTILAET